MKAVIITIGDEILIGQTVDTNSAWLGTEFNKRGIQVEKILSIRDDEKSIHDALDDAFGLAGIVIMTGGLGPTQDDITKQSLCTYFNTELVLSEESLEYVREIVENRGYSLNENNRNQAMLPAACTPVKNHLGTAPVMEFEKDGRLLYSMPGVPFEMKYAMENEVFPRIQKLFPVSAVFHQTIMTYGMPEAFLAEKLTAWASRLPEFVKLAYLPSPGGIKIRLSVYDTSGNNWENSVKKAVEELKQEIPDLIFSEEEKSLEQALSELLRTYNLTLSTAESCTGGLIGSLITSLPGASDVYKGAVVAYSNEIKSEILGVKTDTLDRFGAVSEQCVREMAENIRVKFKTDCSIAVSGIAGPDGGTSEKPVGTVWVAVSLDNEIVTRKYSFGNDRFVNTRRSAYSGMHMLYSLIKRRFINSLL